MWNGFFHQFTLSSGENWKNWGWICKEDDLELGVIIFYSWGQTCRQNRMRNLRFKMPLTGVCSCLYKTKTRWTSCTWIKLSQNIDCSLPVQSCINAGSIHNCPGTVYPHLIRGKIQKVFMQLRLDLDGSICVGKLGDALDVLNKHTRLGPTCKLNGFVDTPGLLQKSGGFPGSKSCRWNSNRIIDLHREIKVFRRGSTRRLYDRCCR